MRVEAFPTKSALLFLAFLGCGLAQLSIGAAIRGDQLALILTLSAAIAAPAIVFVLSALTWRPRAAYFMTVLLIAAQTVIFRHREIADKSIDAQILLKLVATGLMGLMA